MEGKNQVVWDKERKREREITGQPGIEKEKGRKVLVDTEEGII